MAINLRNLDCDPTEAGELLVRPQPMEGVVVSDLYKTEDVLSAFSRLVESNTHLPALLREVSVRGFVYSCTLRGYRLG